MCSINRFSSWKTQNTEEVIKTRQYIFLERHLTQANKTANYNKIEYLSKLVMASLLSGLCSMAYKWAKIPKCQQMNI